MILRDITIGELFSETVSRFPEKAAIRYYGKTITYRELERLADEAAVKLTGSYNHIPKPSTHRPAEEVLSHIICYLATMKAGKVAVFNDELSEKYIEQFSDKNSELLFTSGTTGEPKAVLATHYGRVNSAAAHVEAMGASSDDRFLLAIPLHHCFSLTANLISAITVGATLCIPDDRHTEKLLECAERERCTIFNAVPTIFNAIISRHDISRYDLSSLRTGFIGGAAYTSDFFRRVNDTLNFSLIPGLGQTEGTASYTFAQWTEPLYVRAETVGRFMEHIEGKIAENGEICIRGFCVCKVLNEESSSDGWLHTGDVGFVDSEGYLRYTGRLKDIIVRGGENISPAEIESAVQKVEPGLKEIAVFPLPDDHFGEEICLCAAPANVIVPERLRELLTEKLPAFKVPKYIYLFDSLPQTESGKVAVGVLKDIVTGK